MYNGIGLQTARGSGTNGYVQTNKFFIRSRTGKVAPTTRGFEGDQGTGGITKKPNSDILEHDRKRQIELKLVVLEDKLIDQGFTDAEIAEKVEEARNTLEAAAASEEHGGPGAIILGDSKVSDTQSHQIAARKEKQMEALREALGIAKMSEADEQHADMTEDGPKNGGKWGQKPEHSFLDRDFSWKKSMVEDPKGERDGKKRGIKNLKNKKEDGADDTKPSKKNEYRQRKGRRTADDSGSDSDYVKKKKKLKKHKKSRRDVSDSDDSSMEDDTDSDSGKRKSKTSKNRRKSKKYSSDSYDSSTEDEKYKKPHKRHDSDDDSDDSDTGKPHLKQAVEKFPKSSRRHDSDDSDTNKPHIKQAVEKIHKSSRRHYSSDTDTDTDKRHLKQAAKKIHKSSRRHDSDDSDADKPHLKQAVERIRKSSRRHDSDDDTGPQGGNYQTKVNDYDVDDRWKGDGVHRKSSTNYIGHGKSDKERKLSKELTDKSHKRDHSDHFNVRQSEKGRGRRHDSDDGDDSDTSYGRNSVKKKTVMHAIERKLDSDRDDGNSSEFHKGSSSSDSGSSDSDHSHRKTVKKEPVGGDGAKNTGGWSDHEEKGLKSTVAGADDRRQRNGLGDDLHNSRGDAADKSGYSSRAMMSSKRKLDDAVKEEQEESKSRSRIVGEESGRNRGRWPERDESGSKIRSYQSKNDQRRDDYSNSVKPKGRGDEDVDFKDRSHHEDDEHGSKNYRAHEKNAVEKKHFKGEDDQKGKNYERREEVGDHHRRHGKDDWNQQQTSGKLGRGEDEQRESRGHDREKQITRDGDDLGERRYQRDNEGGDVYQKSGKDGDQERGSHRRGRGEDEHRGSRALERGKQITRDEDDQGERRYERNVEGCGVYKRSGKHDGDQECGSHRRVQGEEEQRGSRCLEREKQVTGDGDDQGERRYQRDEEGGDAYKRSGKDDGAQERGSHKHGRGEEEARGSRGYNRDKEMDFSKKGRYDDHMSSERKRYERDGYPAKYRD